MCIVKETYDSPGESENVGLDSRNLSIEPEESGGNWEGRDFLGKISGKDRQKKKDISAYPTGEKIYVVATKRLKIQLLSFPN